MNRRLLVRRAAFALGLGLIAACATPLEPQAPQAAAAPPAERLLTDALTAEVAAQLGDLPAAIEHYRRVLPNASQLPVIRRATHIMLLGEDYAAADDAIRRWLRLQPDSKQARRIAAGIGLRRGNAARAEAQLRWILQNSKDHGRGFQSIEVLLKSVANKPLAVRVMRGLVAGYPDSTHAKLALARLLYHAGQHHEALREADAVLARRPGHEDALILAARSRVKIGRAEQALAMLGRAVARQPNRRQLRLAYARMLADANRYEHSLEQFDRLIARAPSDNGLIYSTALLAIQARRYEQALRYLRRLLGNTDYEQEAWYYLGLVHERRMQFGSALRWFERVDSARLYLEAQMGAARAQGKSGRVTEALARYRRLHKTLPDKKPTLWMGESDMLYEAGDKQAAFAVLDRAVQAMPRNIDLRYSRALAADRIGRMELLESDLRAVLQQQPDHAHALNALGYTLADKTTRFDEALGLIRRALALEPDDPAIIDSMGWVQYRLGNLDEAVRYLRKASEALQDGEIAAHLGEVLWVKGEREAAVKVWREALREDPDSKVLRRVIQRFNPW